MFRRPVFWLATAAVCVVAGIFAFIYFPRAFPIVSLDIRMDRAGALASARELTERFGWGPEDYRQAASFGLTPQVQEFIELEGGGPEAFRGLMTGEVFHPYRWTVRHFKEQERNETRITFTPGGEPYGFVQVLAEDAPGAALSEDEALAIAELASTDWDIDLAAFERVESSQETRPGGRVDHTFEYERSGARFGDGQLRLRLVVGGDELTGLTHFLEVPEAFSRRYAEMRSTNDVIGALAQAGALLGYLLIGCAVSLFFLHRERWVLWKKPVYWGAFISFLQVLVVFNQLPLLWMGYDTALSSRNFLLQQIGVALGLFILMAGVFSVTFMAAETMTRRAFPDHIQLWRSWSPGVANSPSIAGFTIIGYLLLGIFFAYEVGLYLFAHNMLGWWSPSGALGDPDVLANYFPWLTAIALSLQAGFWEECLFRAVPLAGAALLGKRFGHPKVWIFAALIIQALIFGAAHAPYPTQPAYARVVELIIPSLGFGLLYLCFGLVPAIVLHYAYDVVWFAMPLFAQSAPGAWIDRTILLVFLFVPLIVVFRRRAAAGGWVEVAPDAFNREWRPAPLPEQIEAPPAPADIGAMNPAVRRLLPVAGIVGLLLWGGFTAWSPAATPLQIGRQEAIDIARQELTSRDIDLEPAWRALASTLTAPSPQHRFVWQEGGKEPFDELAGTYLGLPRWRVRFARFEGDVAERAEEYVVQVSGDGEVVRFIHRLPEARPGADLSEDEARQVAGGEVRRQFGLAVGTPDEEGGLTEISAETSKRPERRDWTFTFEDPDNYPLEQGSARVVVTVVGDQTSDARRFVHVPEEWTRTDRNRSVVPNLLSIVAGVIGTLVILAGAVAGGMAWAKGKFSAKVFLVFLAAVFGLTLFQFVNGWPTTVAGLQTALPFASQVVILLVGVAIAAVGLSAILGLVAGWTHRLLLDSGRSAPRLAETLWVGACLGMLVAGVQAALGAAGPSLTPPWANYAAAGASSPLLGAALGPVSGLLTTTLFLLLVCTVTARWTVGWTRRTRLFSLLFVLLGFLGATGTSRGIIAWVASGLVVGVLLLGAYRLVLRYDLTVLPVAVATLLILGQARHVAFEAYPGAVAGRIGAIVVLALIAVVWAQMLPGRPRADAQRSA